MKPNTMLRLTTALLAVMATHASAAGTTAGTTISNTATLESLAPDGTQAPPIVSNSVELQVRHVSALLIAPDGTAAAPGQTVLVMPDQRGHLTYTVSNPSNGDDSISLRVLDTAGTPAAGTQIVAETDGVAGYSAGDQPLTGPLNLAADQTMTVYVRVPVQNAGGTQALYNLSGTTTSTSNGAVSVTDANNVGAVTTTNVYDLALSADTARTLTSPGTATHAHTLTNTGNAALSAGRLSLVATTPRPGWSYTYQLGAGAPSATPQGAVTSWGAALQPGESVALLITATAAAGLGQNETDTLTVTGSYATPSATDVDNTADLESLTATTTVVTPIGAMTKTAESCGTVDANCAAPAALSDNQFVVPGEFVRYTITASNLGNAPVTRPIIVDSVPASTTGARVEASVLSGAGKVLYSLDGGAWTATAPTITGLAGAQLRAAYDANNDNAITADDGLAPGEQFRMRLTVRVN